jgi:hypothetical protein
MQDLVALSSLFACFPFRRVVAWSCMLPDPHMRFLYWQLIAVVSVCLNRTGLNLNLSKAARDY